MAFLDELAARLAVFAAEHPGFGQADNAPRLPAALPQPGAGEMAAPHRRADPLGLGCGGRVGPARLWRGLSRTHPWLAAGRSAGGRPRPVRRTEGRLPRRIFRFHWFTM